MLKWRNIDKILISSLRDSLPYVIFDDFPVLSFISRFVLHVRSIWSIPAVSCHFLWFSLISCHFCHFLSFSLISCHFLSLFLIFSDFLYFLYFFYFYVNYSTFLSFFIFLIYFVYARLSVPFNCILKCCAILYHFKRLRLLFSTESTALISFYPLE